MGIKKIKYNEIIDALTDALGRSDDQSTEEVLEDIREDGIDVDATMARLKKAQQNISMKAKRSVLESARTNRLKLAEKGYEFIGRFSDWTKDQILERIKALSGPEAGLAYRDLEALGEEEMVSILEDLEMACRSSIEDNDKGE